ncbi:hypothetical protein FB451DRAFT_1178516 [Mycena latifolia]|nr:hypothetical protein FB451DRAFT_1178516 [Mycena latifolia]
MSSKDTYTWFSCPASRPPRKMRCCWVEIAAMPGDVAARAPSQALSELPPLAGGGFQSRAGRRFAEARKGVHDASARSGFWRLSAIFVGVTTLPPGTHVQYKFCSILKREYEPKYEPVADLNHRNVGRVMGLTEDIHPNLVELRGNPELRDIEILVQQTEALEETHAPDDETLHEIQKILYSTEEGFEVPEGAAEGGIDEEETFEAMAVLIRGRAVLEKMRRMLEASV